MKLTSINCPNCNGQLREEGGKLICVSCGSAFAIDYDESDVEHERLQTEAERERIRVEREKELMATRMRLEEESQMRRAERSRKQATSSIAKLLAIPLVIMFAGSFLSVIIFGIIGVSVNRSARRNSKATDYSSMVTQKARESITKEQILGDQTFIDNALASGKSFAKNKHNGGVHDWDLKSEVHLDEVPEAFLSGEPRLENVYFVETDEWNLFIMIFKLEFNYPNTDLDRTRTMYFSCYLSDISVKSSGKISTDYQVGYDSGTGADGLFYAYNDKDQLYRETVLAKGGDIMDLTEDLVSGRMAGKLS